MATMAQADSVAPPSVEPPAVAAPPGAPLVNEPVPVAGRQPIHENLHTGFKALDALAPVGRGQSTLLLGAPRAQAAVRRTLRRNLLPSVGGGAEEIA